MAFTAMSALAGYVFYTDSSNYRALQQGYDQQSQVLASLSNNYTTLYDVYVALTGNYTALFNQYVTLQSSYALLQSSYDDMTKIANLQKNQTIASGTALHIPKNSFDSVEIQTYYAGYIRVQLQATHPVTVMLTNYKYPTTVDFPVSGTPISLGNFVLPILDGTNYLEIYSPSDMDTTVTVTITLYY